MPRSDKNLTMEDVVIAFRNFQGKEDTYNRAGDRNFSILLEPQQAQKMMDDGWNVKFLKPRDDEQPQAYIQVAVSYKARPPKICMITSRGLTYLDESMVEMLDWADIETADVTLNPYEWVVNGKSGVKAYLQSLFVKIEEDYLQLKWENWAHDRKALTTGEDYIDAEFHEERPAIGR